MLRSLDLRDLLSKVQAVQEAYQGVVYQADTDQRHIGIYLDRMFTDKQRQAPEVPPAQEPRVQHYRRREEERKGKGRGRRNQPGWEEDPTGMIVDMKV